MATAAQIEANRRNAKLSTGPRTEAGKHRSRFNALDHGCRANILVLASEEFGAYEDQCRAWKLSFRPRNPAEEFLIAGIVRMGFLTTRIDQAQTARLNTRMHYGVFDEQAREEEKVIELGQKLFRDALKIRTTATELDIATIASLSRSVPTVNARAIDQSVFFDEDDMIAPDEPLEELPPAMDEPGPPNEANLAGENAPNEPNLHEHAITSDLQDGHKEFRIDTPHLARKPGGIGRNRKNKGNPTLERVLGGQKSTILNLSPIFGAVSTG